MIKLLIGAVLALTASNAVADNVFIYENNDQQALTASNEIEGNVFIYENSNQSDKFTEKVRTTYHRDKNNKGSVKTERSSYVKPAYAALR